MTPSSTACSVSSPSSETGALLLEITETAVMADLDRARRTLSRLREHGVLISLDDFGTSYSSLGALATLPIDGIKIDRVFVDGLAGAKGPDIVAAIVGLARTLDKVTVIEGVETEEQFATLAAIGVDRVQGYLIGRPGPLEDFAVRLTGRLRRAGRCRPAPRRAASAVASSGCRCEARSASTRAR